jgi:hypothetical protein
MANEIKENLKNLKNDSILIERIEKLEKEIEDLKERLSVYSSEGTGIDSLYDFREKVFELMRTHGWF